MVRDIRYVTLNCKYRDLQHVLQSTRMKSLPLVESAGETRAGGSADARASHEARQDGGEGLVNAVSGANTAPRCRPQSP